MDKKELIDYIENSFLKEILQMDNVTDISYNGTNIYYVTNIGGRVKYPYKVDPTVVRDFLRQLSNITEKQFSYLSPTLDVNVGRYRINAINSTVGRVGLDECYTFSVRIASLYRKINKGDNFMPKPLEDLFSLLIKNHMSIVISGITGVGKTEFQKYLISLMNENERILVIDNTIELAFLEDNEKLDITLWQADERNADSSISNLIRNGLRNNPDWMIVSEARGKEMNDVLNSAMTGIPIITTIHSLDGKSGIPRMARMIMNGEMRMNYEDIISNLSYHFRIVVHLRKFIDNYHQVTRYISSVVQVESDGTINEIYKDDLKSKKYNKLSTEFLSLLSVEDNEKIKEFM